MIEVNIIIILLSIIFTEMRMYSSALGLFIVVFSNLCLAGGVPCVPDVGWAFSASEYAEMQEFAATIAGKIGQLPARPEKKNLETQAKVLQELVAQKATTQQIGLASRALSSALLAAYPVPIALPRVFPMSLAAPSSSRRTAPPAMARQATAGDRARRSSRPPYCLHGCRAGAQAQPCRA